MDITPDMLKRYHLDQCTAAEREAINAWLEDDNIQIANKYSEISPADIAHSRQTMWQFLDGHIDDEGANKMKPRRMRWSGWVPYVAASFLLVALAALGLLNYGLPSGKERLTILALHVPAGAMQIITLGDGTRIHLHPGSSLNYPQTFAPDRREVELTGEAYFEVSVDKQWPFTIKTLYGTEVRVIGTAFNVKAQEADSTVEVAVSEGVVHFMKSENQQEFVELTVGQSALYDRKTALFARGSAEVSDIGGWRDNKLLFDEETVENIVRKLEIWYGVQIDVQHQPLLDRKYSARYTSPTLDELLKSMAFVLDYQYKIDKKNKTVIIY